MVADGGSVTVSSSASGSNSDGANQHWIRHASARIAPDASAPEGSSADLSAAVPAPGAADAEFADESVTSLWETWGSEGRPFGWSIGSCESKAGELRADVGLTQASAVALLDAAIHIARLLDSDNPRLMVPAAVAGVRFVGRARRTERPRRGAPSRRQRRGARRRHRRERCRTAAPCIERARAALRGGGLERGRRP